MRPLAYLCPQPVLTQAPSWKKASGRASGGTVPIAVMMSVQDGPLVTGIRITTGSLRVHVIDGLGYGIC